MLFIYVFVIYTLKTQDEDLEVVNGICEFDK